MSRLWVPAVLCIVSVSVAAGLVTETSASNKPPFSFACTIAAGGGSSSFCSGNDKPFVQIEKVKIFRDYTNKVGACLDPEKDYIIALLSDWFNNECKLAPNDRRGDNIKLPTQYLLESMTKYCNISQPTIAKIEVNYDCVRNPDEILNIVTVKPRPGGPTIATRPNGPTDLITNPPLTTKATTTIPSRSTMRPDLVTNGGTSGIATTQRLQDLKQDLVLVTTVANFPPFSLRCSALTNFKSCAPAFTLLQLSKIDVVSASTQALHTLCPRGVLALTNSINAMINYFENDCLNGAAEMTPFSIPALDYVSALAAHCGMKDVSGALVLYVAVTVTATCTPHQVPRLPSSYV